jgi:hypothetical protein
METKTTTQAMRQQECAREGCTTAPQWGERYCSVLHRRQDEILRWEDVDPEEDAEDGPAEPRTGWREDGRVDIDAVRAGTPDLADAPAVFESLCDEVEELRSVVAKVNVQMQRVESYSAPVPTVIAFDALGAVRDIIGGVR